MTGFYWVGSSYCSCEPTRTLYRITFAFIWPFNGCCWAGLRPSDFLDWYFWATRYFERDFLRNEKCLRFGKAFGGTYNTYVYASPTHRPLVEQNKQRHHTAFIRFMTFPRLPLSLLQRPPKCIWNQIQSISKLTNNRRYPFKSPTQKP